MKHYGRWFCVLQCVLAGFLVAWWCAGCVTQKVNWDSRVGVFTFDQVVLEMGPPDRSAKLQDGVTVAEWLTQRGFARGTVQNTSGTWVEHYYEPPMPDYYLRLTFGPDGKLRAWKRVAK
jgi:hypothetical protein